MADPVSYPNSRAEYDRRLISDANEVIRRSRELLESTQHQVRPIAQPVQPSSELPGPYIQIGAGPSK